jgi:predicted RND superfamily exporter protein
MPQEWLPDSDPVKAATDFVDEEFLGSGRIELIIDTQRENGIQEPEVLRRMESIAGVVKQIGLEQDNRLGKTISLLDIIKETNQALNENQLAHYKIPTDRELIAQELLLFENSGSDDLEEYTDSQFSLARMSIRAKRVDSFINIDFFDDIEQEFKDIIGDQAEVRMTGLLVLMSAAMKAVILSLSRSYGIALMLITPLMMLLIGSVRGGLISMVPNITPILMTLGLMGWFDLPMDVFTLLIGAIAIGLAVDDTIHFIHSFQRYYHESGDAELAIQQTMRTTGKALLFTSLVLATGFFIFMLSSMSNLFNFGLLTGFAISAAFLCDVTVTPALLILASRTKKPWNLGQRDDLSDA